MVRNFYGLARHCNACYIPLLIQTKSASEGWGPKSHLFPHTCISFIVPLALKALLQLNLMLSISKVQPQISGMVFAGSFQPLVMPGLPPQGPGPRLLFLAKDVATVGLLSVPSWTQSVGDGEGELFSWVVLHCLEPEHCTRTLQVFTGLGSSGANAAKQEFPLECHQVTINLGYYRKVFLFKTKQSKIKQNRTKFNKKNKQKEPPPNKQTNPTTTKNLNQSKKNSF